MFYETPCFVIKKNPGSTQSPWLGVIPRLSQKELFGQINQILIGGGKLVTFRNPEDAYSYIDIHYPEYVDTMQVYEMKERPGGIDFVRITRQ